MGQIVHGNKNFGYAPIINNDGVLSFGTPVLIPGMVSSTLEVEQDETKIFADDKTFCKVKGAKARTLEVVLRNIPDTYAEYLGFKINDNGMLTDTGSYPAHCVFFESEDYNCDTGVATTTLHYLYNVIASEPSRETNTDEEEVQAAEFSVSYTASDSTFVVDDDNKYAQYGYITRTDANAAVYDTFKTTVLLPTTDISI